VRSRILFSCLKIESRIAALQFYPRRPGQANEVSAIRDP
jgi:hypothetical protein